MISREFKLYLNAGVGVAPVINANQFDQSEEWVFTLLHSDGTVYTPSTGAIIGLKSDGTTILNAGTVNSSGQVVITETEQMTAVPGSNIFEILIDGNTHGTANFVVFVERRPGDIDNPSESDISLFQEAIEAAGNVTQFQADISALQSGLATTNANLTSEANTRASADATLQSNISAEASTRQTQDAVLQAEIDQIIAPSGEAPSAAEVQNARIGVDGTTYDTLGNAIRGQVSDLKNALQSVERVIVKESDTPNIEATYTTVTDWGVLTAPMTSGKTYRVGVNLTGWTAEQIGKINSIGLYVRQSASAIVTTLDFGGFVADTWLYVDYTVPADVSITAIKISVKGSYVAGDNSVSYKITELTAIDTTVEQLASQTAENTNRLSAVESDLNAVEQAERIKETVLHLSYYPTTHRYIATNTNLWSNNANANTVVIPVDGAVQYTITAGSEHPALYALLTDYYEGISVNTEPSYADGFTALAVLNAGESVTITVPMNARYLYLGDIITTITTYSLPSEVIKKVPSNYNSLKKPMFVFMDDDAHKVALAWLEQVVDATRIPISIALITGVVQEEQDSDKYTTWNNLRRLRNKGFVFVNHTNTTVSINTMTRTEIEESFKESQRLMEAHGMPNSDILVYPGGNVSSDNIDLVKNYFRFGVSTQQNINVPPIKTWFLNRIDLDPTSADQLDTWKAQVDKTLEINGLCIFYSHAYHEEYDSAKLADYISLVNYVAQKGGRIVSLPQALEEYRNNISTENTSWSATTGFVGCDTVIV